MDDKEIRKLKDKANELYTKGSYDKAIEIYVRVTDASPRDAASLQRLAECFKRQKQNRRALEVYQRLAEHYGKEGFLLQGIAVCKIILDIEPEHSATQEMLADLYSKKYGTKKGDADAPRSESMKVEPIRAGAPVSAARTKASPPPAARPAVDTRPATAPAAAAPAPSKTAPADVIDLDLDMGGAMDLGLTGGISLELESAADAVSGGAPSTTPSFGGAAAMPAAPTAPPPRSSASEPPVTARGVAPSSPVSPAPALADGLHAAGVEFDFGSLEGGGELELGALGQAAAPPAAAKGRPEVAPVDLGGAIDLGGGSGVDLGLHEGPPVTASARPLHAPGQTLALDEGGFDFGSLGSLDDLGGADIPSPVASAPAPAPAPVAPTASAPPPALQVSGPQRAATLASPPASAPARPAPRPAAPELPPATEVVRAPMRLPESAMVARAPVAAPVVSVASVAPVAAPAPARAAEGPPPATGPATRAPITAPAAAAPTQTPVDVDDPMMSLDFSELEGAPAVVSAPVAFADGLADAPLGPAAIEALLLPETPLSDELAEEVFTADVVGDGAPLDGPEAPAIEPSTLPRIPLFSDLDRGAFIALLRQMTLLHAEPGELILREGAEGDSLFVIVSGSVRVYRGAGALELELARLGEGAFFGEMALISNAPRSASVQALDAVELFEISREVVADVATRFPSVRQALLNFYRERLLWNLMETSPIFAPFSRGERKELVSRFRAKTFEPGDVMLEEGALSEWLCLIMTGDAAVTKVGRLGKPVAIGSLREGEIFGEASLLTRRPSLATVTARRRTLVLRLGREVFDELVMTHPVFLEYVSEIAEERLRTTRTAVGLAATPGTAGSGGPLTPLDDAPLDALDAGPGRTSPGGGPAPMV